MTIENVSSASRNPYPVNDAVGLKDRGNQKFARCLFNEAVALYTDAIGVINNGCDVDSSLGAVLLSNRSSAYYEMGKYSKY